MKSYASTATSFAAASALFRLASASLTPITTNGNAFFSGSDRFYIRGVDYQPGGSSQLADPLADESTCTRDIKYFQQLKINTVRVYSVDNSANHDACMKALDDAGIYLVLDVNTPKYSINQDDPNPSYNEVYLQSVFATVEMFSKYDNTLAFLSANEVLNQNASTTAAAPYVKAVTRDMKLYQQDRKLRKIPVGYGAADVSDNRYEMSSYLNCGDDAMARSDFFAFNDYEWCDPSSYEQSGWDQKVAFYSNYSIPIFLSEYGCVTNTRTFEEVKSLYGTQMTPVYSGGLVFEYANEPNNFGLVTVDNGQVTLRPDFSALQKAFAGTPLPTGDGGYKTNNPLSTCPTKTSTWLVDSDALPAMPAKAQQYLTKGAGSGPGLDGNDGNGSQDAGTASSGTASAGSDQPTATASSSTTPASSSSAANAVTVPALGLAPFAIAAFVTLSSLMGAALL